MRQSAQRRVDNPTSYEVRVHFLRQFLGRLLLLVISLRPEHDPDPERSLGAFEPPHKEACMLG